MKIHFNDEQTKEKMKIFDELMDQFFKKVEVEKEESPEESEEFAHLKDCYYQATCICDPTEHAVRQKRLLHAIAEFLIQECETHED